MSKYIVARVSQILSRKFRKSLSGAKILFLGVAYKKDVADLRESPVLKIIRKFEEDNVVVSYYDPYIPEFTNNRKNYKSLKEHTEEEIREKDIVIITTDYMAVDYKMVVKNAKAVFDTQNAIKFNNNKVEKL